jgi:hypothetical protein
MSSLSFSASMCPRSLLASSLVACVRAYVRVRACGWLPRPPTSRQSWKRMSFRQMTMTTSSPPLCGSFQHPRYAPTSASVRLRVVDWCVFAASRATLETCSADPWRQLLFASRWCCPTRRPNCGCLPFTITRQHRLAPHCRNILDGTFLLPLCPQQPRRSVSTRCVCWVVSDSVCPNGEAAFSVMGGCFVHVRRAAHVNSVVRRCACTRTCNV